MASTDDPARDHAALLERTRQLYPGIRVGRPGRSRSYWVTITALRALRARYAIDLAGADHVAPGATILVGNHSSTLDPVVVVMGTWWRVGAFTKLEWFSSPLAPFFRCMGQIPLRRGDERSTELAMDFANLMLADGSKIGLYPEGTRSPDPGVLHRLHKRVLIPLLEANPDVPVHAVGTRFTPRRWRRTAVRVRISPPLALDARTLDAEEVTTVLRDALLELTGLAYVDRYARDVKAERAAARPPEEPRS